MAKAKKRSKGIFIIPGILLVVLAIYLFSPEPEKPSKEALMELVGKHDIIEKVTGSGKIFPEEELVITSDVSGTLVEVYVEEGDSVKKGAPLAKVDADAIQSIVERAEAAANSSKAQVASAKAQKTQTLAQLGNQQTMHERNIKLFEDGVISKADFDASLSALETAKANVEAAEQNVVSSQFNVKSAQATVKEQKENLSRTTIYAPMSGIVSRLNKKKGEQVVGTIQMAGTEILRIANMYSLEVQIDVSENDIPKVSYGDTCDIEVDAFLGRSFQGVVTHIANTASGLQPGVLNNEQVTNFVVKIRLIQDSYLDLIRDGQPLPFRPGMSATADIKTNTIRQTIAIPIQAVTTREPEDGIDDDEDLKELVFVTSADTVKSVEVVTGIQDDKYIQILSGLNLEEKIITGPYSLVSKKLEKGNRVKEVTEEELYKKKDKE